MMKIISVLSLVLLTALVWAYEVPAASWEYVYNGDKLPDDDALGDSVWRVYKTEGIASSDVCEVTASKELHIVDPNDKVCFFMRDVDNAEKATVEAKVKVLSQSGAAYALLLGIEDGAKYTWLDLFPDHVQLDGGASHNIDMTEYHTLRIARDGDNVTIYVDNEEVIKGQPGGTGDRKNIIFGAGSTGATSESYWDYVAFTTAGAFSPAELQVVAAVKRAGKLTTKWATIKVGY